MVSSVAPEVRHRPMKNASTPHFGIAAETLSGARNDVTAP
jgi:hypothetical protein